MRVRTMRSNQPCEGPEAAPFPGFPGSMLSLPLVQDVGYDVRPRALRQGGVEERSVRGKLSQVGKPFSAQPFLTVPIPQG